MSYPDPAYLGEGGEVTATHRPHDHAPDFVYANGTQVHYLITGARTGGLFGLYRWEMEPEAGGPGPHFHRTMTESFYVLTGTVAIFDGRDWVQVVPGGFVHVPIGGIHGFRNASPVEPASMLLHFAPGAPREAYFEGLPEMAGMDDEARAAFFLAHDNHWL